MSLEKSIEHGKDWRKPRRHPLARRQYYMRSCLPGGSCGYCQDNRFYTHRKNLDRALREMREYGFNIGGKRLK